MAEIVGSLSVKHNVDPIGSLSIDVPLMLPSAKMAPNITISYHSAATNVSTIGIGWAVKGASCIERVPATIAQDQLRGAVNYDINDKFALDGQRLISVGNNEYRFELETWSKVVAHGSVSNPDYWVEYLPDGTQRTFGNTMDSNIKAAQGSATRVWAVSQNVDPFKNYVSYSYLNDTINGAFYLARIQYGGNMTIQMSHQRRIEFAYADRPDKRTTYLGGYKIAMNKRLSTVTSYVNGTLVHVHSLSYGTAPLSGVSRLNSISLADASGRKVRPIKFDWNDSNPAIFGNLIQPTTIDTHDTTARVMPMDVHATGRTDLVVASKRFKGSQKLHLEVFRADTNGVISSTPESTSQDDIAFPTQLLPLDFNGDGCNDLLHITTSTSSHTLTILLSTPNGFKALTPITFTPEYIGGTFYVGDFEANGRVGLCYIYQILRRGTPQLRYTQFVSDGQKFTPLSPCDGPAGVGEKSIKVVVGDLNGDHAEDVFIMYPAFKNGGSKVQIELLQSNSNGRLQYRRDRPLLSIADTISWTTNINFLPYSADEDGKTSLLVVSPDLNSNLQLQMIRSSGPTLLPPSPPVATGIAYNGNVTLAKTSSTTTIDLVNTFNTKFASPPQTEVTVLRFFNDSFTILNNVKQPGITSTFVAWADLRGIGRSDCLLATTDYNGKITIKPMPSATSQPPDFISGYENGLGARLSVAYAPLSDPNTYATDTKDSSNSPVASVNAMARNVSFTANLSSSSLSQTSAHTRSQVVYFPTYVVKQLKHRPYAARPDVVDESDYTYRTARYGFDGRAWLGFETIIKTAPALGSSTATDYYQQFPFIGQQKEVRVTDSASGKLLQVTGNNWKSIAGYNNQFVCLSGVKESNYESGVLAYEVDVDYGHDKFGNITSMVTRVPQSGAPALSIACTFSNDASAWVLGQKTSETVTSGSTTLKQTKNTFHRGSHTAIGHSQWVDGDTWSTQTIELDSTGNEIAVKGPGQALRKFIYDPTFTHLASSSVYTSASAPPLTETAVFDLASGKPLSTTSPNGEMTSINYDILGRVKEISMGSREMGMKVVEKQAFETDGTNFYHIEYTDSDENGGDVWFMVVDHLDGMSRVWRREVPRPEDPTSLIYSDIEYDGAGRIVKRARDYIAGTSPAHATFLYDSLSRLINQSLPPAASDVASIRSAFKYSFVNGVMHAKETRSDGNSTDTVTTVREITHLPNPQPSATKLTKSFVTASIDELNRPIRTEFDGLGRPITISDPLGNSLVLGWDGLDRAVTRQIFNNDGSSKKNIQKTSAIFEDELGKVTINNELAGTCSVVVSDWANRPLSKVTPDESFTFVYDTGGQYTKEHLVSVSSTKGIGYKFDYDQRGNISSSTLSIDSLDYTSSYKWSVSGELLRTTNPDGSVMTRTMYSDGATVKRVELADPLKAVRAWVNLNDFNDAVNRPLKCEFGNGISSTCKLADNGSLAHMSLEKGGTTIHQQSWKIDAFSRINGYESSRAVQGQHAQASSSHTFTYDAAGQLAQRGPDTASADTRREAFAYDDCGNIKNKDGRIFLNKGWQLDQIEDEKTGATEFTFKYSDDGNLISKLDSTGKQTASMKYDSEGRLIALNATSFVYDYGGRLIKAVLPNGDIRIYPSHTYEVDIPVSGNTTHSAYLVHGYRRAVLSTTASSSTVNYFHTDHLGSTIAVSDARGDIITEYAYDSFGQALVTSGNDVARYKFSGKEMFDGLYYFGSRFYDPDTGRFLTLDSYPVDIQNVTPSTFNMYSFSRNDPVNFVDMNGNVPWWHWLVDAVLIAVGIALLFVPGVNAIVVGVMAVVTGALIGGGMAGAVYDVHAQISGTSDDKAWGMAVGLGALFGGISGGLSAGVDALLPAVTLVDVSSNMGAIGVRMVAGWVVKTVARVAIKTAFDTGLGVLRQMSVNGIEGNRWDENLGEAAASSAISSVESNLKGVAKSFIKPIKGSGFRLKFWKNRKWKVYGVAAAEKNAGLGKLSKGPEYPLPSSEPRAIGYKPLGFDGSFMAQSSSRFVSVEMVGL